MVISKKTEPEVSAVVVMAIATIGVEPSAVVVMALATVGVEPSAVVVMSLATVRTGLTTTEKTEN